MFLEPESNKVGPMLPVPVNVPWTGLSRFAHAVGPSCCEFSTGARLTDIIFVLCGTEERMSESPFDLVIFAMMISMLRGTLMLMLCRPRVTVLWTLRCLAGAWMDVPSVVWLLRRCLASALSVCRFVIAFLQ